MTTKTKYACTVNGKPMWIADSLQNAKYEIASASIWRSVDNPNGYEFGTQIGELVWLDPLGNRLSVRRVTPQHAGRIAAQATRRRELAWQAWQAKCNPIAV